MSKFESPPFQRGETYFGIGGTVDTTSGLQHEGKEFTFEDVNFSNTSVVVKPHRTNQPVTVRSVRNNSGFAVLPKRIVKLQGGDHGKIQGYAATTADGPVAVVDEHLPAAGFPANDLCYVVVQGPSLVLLSLVSGAGECVVAVNSRLVSATGATSGATTAGRVEVQVLTGATAPLAAQIQNAIGVALSAATTGNTGADLLISVRRW